MPSLVRIHEGDNMRRRAFRAALTAAVFCFSSLLLACELGQLRVRIPDFFSSDVQGVRLYRVDDATGELVDAGRIEFVSVGTSAQGEYVEYMQYTPDGQPGWGPVYAPIERLPDDPNGVDVTLGFSNTLPSGWFKVASYNLIGTSKPSSTQTFVEV